MRQISIKDPGSTSWFVSCNHGNDRLHKYNLPNIYTVRQVFESEAEFKQQVKFGTDRYVKDSWSSTAANRKSLSLLNMEACNIEVHPCWKSVDSTVIDVKRAIVKVRFLIGTYHLQSVRAKFNRSDMSSLFPLCAAAPEDRPPFSLYARHCIRPDSHILKHLKINF